VTVAVVAALGALAAATALVGLRSRRRTPVKPGAGRILVPFTGGALDERVLNAAIRIARAEDATLVPTRSAACGRRRASTASSFRRPPGGAEVSHRRT
jgi:hypothetical protein